MKHKYNRRRTVESSSSSSDSESDEYETVSDSDPESSVEAPPKKKTRRAAAATAPPKKSPKDENKKKSDKKPEKKSAAAAAAAADIETSTSESEEDDDEEDDETFYSGSENSQSESETESDPSASSSPRAGAFKIFIAPAGAALPQEEFFGSDMETSKDEDYTSEDERNFMKEKYEKVATTEEILTSKERAEKEKRDKRRAREKTRAEKLATKDVSPEYKELLELKKQLLDNLAHAPKNKILKNAIRDCNKSIKKLIKDARNKNATNYIQLIKKATSQQKVSEVEFFKKKMSNTEQLKIMGELEQINQHIFVEKPYRLALLETKIPAKYKAIALQKLNMLKNMEPGESEYYKVKTWVDTFMRVPFGVYNSLSVSMTDGVDACNDFIQNAKNILDNCVYGLEDAKLQVLQMVGQWISNPASMGTAIAIKGPPGTGKTSLIKDGVSKIFGREFAFLPLGGATDSAYLEGHSYTYEGSQWGRIIQILIDGKSMNPVIFFDELDKVSDTPRGEEIIGILTHLTDTTQNSQFHDKYFSELEFDLSKCLFVFSYNDESKVNPILRDRMYVIQTKGYETKDKLVIAKKYLLPKIREQVNFTEEEVIIPDDVISYIISNQEMTRGEEGVRNLKRCLEIIYTKLNLYRLIKPDTNIFAANIGLEGVSFPYTLTKKSVDILIKNTDKVQNHSLLNMYI